jgi:hypothetical protein
VSPPSDDGRGGRDAADSLHEADAKAKASPTANSEVTAQRSCGGPSKLDQATVARDQLAAVLKEQRSPPAAVTAGYNTETGAVAAAFSRDRQCCEEHVVALLGGDPSKVRFTKATRPRTGEEVPICLRCQEKYIASQFPPGTKFSAGKQG